MKDVRDKVAVITGAASGIGRSLAERFAAAGMKVVLSDVDGEALADATAVLSARGADVRAVLADVARLGDVQQLARESLRTFGAVHVVCNNAGVFAPGGVPSWTTSADDWQWILGVNLMGVVHGQQAFLPILIEQGVPAHVVNVASIGGFIAGNPLYSTTKFGVLALSECLYTEMKRGGHAVGVSVVCPGYVQTRIADAERSRPSHLRQASPQSAGLETLNQYFAKAVDEGIAPSIVAERVLDAILRERFYVFTHAESLAAIERKTALIVSGENPVVSNFDAARR